MNDVDVKHTNDIGWKACIVTSFRAIKDALNKFHVAQAELQSIMPLAALTEEPF